MARAEQILMIDLDSKIPERFLDRLLAKDSLAPPSAPRRSRPSALGGFPRSMPKA
ncbi:hypothetical protein BH11MYX4_BH11MYX4_13990 [soil metagenome]